MVELILSQHDCQCVTCARSGCCSLQKIANDLNIIDIPYRQEIDSREWNQDFPLIRDSAKCIKCMRCVQVCDKVQGLNVWDVEGTGSRTHSQCVRTYEDRGRRLLPLRPVYHPLSGGRFARAGTIQRRCGSHGG